MLYSIFCITEGYKKTSANILTILDPIMGIFSVLAFEITTILKFLFVISFFFLDCLINIHILFFMSWLNFKLGVRLSVKQTFQTARSKNTKFMFSTNNNVAASWVII
jgi:hypothetical protein